MVLIAQDLTASSSIQLDGSHLLREVRVQLASNSSSNLEAYHKSALDLVEAKVFRHSVYLAVFNQNPSNNSIHRLAWLSQNLQSATARKALRARIVITSQSVASRICS